MQLKHDASIYTANGDELGRLERMVVDPPTGEVTHIVIRKGWFFQEERVVPIELVDSAEEDKIRLREEIEDLESLPVFEEQHYVEVDEQAGRQTTQAPAPETMVYWYPPLSTTVGFPAYYRMPFPVTSERNIPEGTIPLNDGARVISANGDHVGNIEQIFTQDDDRVTHFVIAQGLIFKNRKLVPTTWIRNVEEDEVILSVSTQTLDKLPDYHE